MNDSNRRTFLKVAGATTVAAGAIAVVVPATAAAAPAAATTLPPAATGPLVAYIADVTTGEIAVMIEGREVTVTDHQLVAKLAHALHSAPVSKSV